ncbi:hypothetical protein [Bacillus solitudinis]|uniref:hypothetical protein n=1 Tax=Bacillus solitudinis TaxID=2014074 RepID=UPI000C231698|nr:hypothetical protein [Bacillus solitudinis]
MSIALFLIGILTIFLAIIFAFFTHTGGEFFLVIIGGVSTSFIFFALAKIIDNQETTIHHIQQQLIQSKNLHTAEKISCENCKRDYDHDFTSCPHCGFRES